MPIVNRRIAPVTSLDTGSIADAPDVESPSILDTLGAAFRQNNTVGSLVQRVRNVDTVDNNHVDDDPMYNAWDEIKGTPYEDHWDSFALSNNRNYTAALKRQVDQESRDRRTIASSGWSGTLANLGATVVDPTLLVPVGGEIIKGAQGGYKILDAGIRTSIAGGIATAAQETALHATQEERTGEESAHAIGGAILLGGILGGGVSALLSRGERAAAIDAVDRITPTEGGGGLSAAATTRTLPIDALTVDGGAARGIAQATQFLSPNMRLNFSPSAVARQVGQELSEGTLYQAGHAEGLTTGPAVSRLAGMNERARLATGIDSLRSAYRDMKKSGVNMTFDDFDDAVGRAMRNEDIGENDFISSAAKSLRGSVVKPFYEDGKAVGLYEDGDDVSFAPSYFPRQYRTKVLVANEPAVKAEWTEYMGKRISADYQNAAESLRVKHGNLDAAAADLKLAPEERTSQAAAVEAQISDTHARAPEHADRTAQIDDLRAKAREAKAAGDEAGMRAAREEVRRLTEEGGAAFKEHLSSIKRLTGRLTGLAETDAGKLEEMAAGVEQKRATLLRAFYDRWEIRNLGEGIDPLNPATQPNFHNLARETIDDVYAKLTGRDYGSSASVAPEYLTPIERGPVRERTLPIPDWMLQRQGVLENRASHVMHRYARTLAADVELTRRFGDARLDNALKRVAEDYDKLRNGVTDPAQLAGIDKRQKADQRDLEALRDLVRGTYKAAENASNFGRVSRAAGHFNFARQLGGVVVSSLSDIYRPAMVMGLRRFMGEGIAPLMRNLDAVKLSVKEAKLAGTVVESVLGHRVASIAGIADPMERGLPIERLLENMANLGGKYSGINLWTDGMKAITSIMAQNRILDGSASRRTLAFLGIDDEASAAIRSEFASHGEIMDGVHVANTEQWTNQDAVRAFRAAVGKDVDSVIVTPGIGDTPLFARTPLGKMMLQFKSFTLASHQRVMLRGMQENKARFVSGVIGMSSIGLLSTYLRAWRGGRDRFEKFKQAAQNPGYLIGEALDSSGIFTVPFDAANTGEKLTSALGPQFSFNPLKTPLKAAGAAARPGASREGESVRFANRSPLSTIAGPTGGLIESGLTALGGGLTAATGGKVSKKQRNAAESLIPYNTWPLMREAIQAMNDDSPYVNGSDDGNAAYTADAL